MKLFSACLIISCVLSGNPATAAATKRPNIVFAFADDWGRYASAYAGLKPGTPSDLIHTPSFDRVAREGVLFRNAFVTAPSCTPCRSSLLSGQYFFRTGRGAILQGAVWDGSVPSYPLLLQKAGYHIGHSYKVWSPGTPANAPYGGKATAYNSAGNRFSGFSQVVSKRAQNGEMDAARKELYGEVRHNFQAFMKDRKGDEPFCYWFGPTNVHRKWVKGSGKALWGMNPDDLKGKLPAFLPDVPEIRQDMCDYLGEVKAFDEGVGILLNELEQIGELENTLFVISGDHGFPGFPNGKCSLYDTGVGVPLAMRWPGQIPAARVVDDMVNLTDLAPTFLEAAGEKPLEVMTGRSLVPVIKSSKSGQIDPSRDFVVVGRERHVARARTGNLPYPQRAIRTKKYLYIRNFKPERWPMGIGPGHGAPDRPFANHTTLENNTFACFGDMDASPTKAWIIEHRNDPDTNKYFEFAFGRRPAEELYDNQADPDQIHNVIEDPKYADVRRRLSQRLMKVLTDAADPRVIGDGSTFEKPPYIVVPPARKPAPKSKKRTKALD